MYFFQIIFAHFLRPAGRKKPGFPGLRYRFGHGASRRGLLRNPSNPWRLRTSYGELP
jgi:hypothetical protein